MKKVVIGFVCVLLGIIIGIGAIAGTIYALLSINVDTILGWVGLEDDNKDEDGNYIYVRGDQSLLKTITDTVDFFSDLDTSTLRGLDAIIPAVGYAINQTADYLEDSTGVTLDVDGLMDCPIDELGDWLSDFVREIQVYPVVEKLLPSYVEGDDVIAIFVRALVLGTPAETVEIEGVVYPVYYYVSGSEFDEESGETIDTYSYYYVDLEGRAYIVAADKNGVFQPTGDVYLDYDPDEATCTGDYYSYSAIVENEDGEKEEGTVYVPVNYVILGDFYESENLTDSIYAITLEDILGGDENIINDLFGEYTLGELIEGDIDFDDIPIAAFIDLNPAEDETLIALLYGVNGINPTDDGSLWTCVYNDDDGAHQAYIITDENGYIDRIYYYETDEEGNYVYDEDGELVEIEVEGVLLGGVSGLLDNLELVTVMGYPDVDDALMMYILYGVTDVYKVWSKDDEGNLLCDDEGNPIYDYYAYYVDENGQTFTAYITTTVESDGTIKATSSSYTVDGETRRPSTATTLDNISDVVSGVTTALSVADFVDEIDADEAIFLYICYSVYDVYKDGEGNYYGYMRDSDGEEVMVRIYLKDKNEKDSKDLVDYIVVLDDEGDPAINDDGNETRVKGTKIDEISGIMDNITEDLSLPVFLGDMEAEDNALMLYLMYSVTNVESHTETVDGKDVTVWTATYHYTYEDSGTTVSAEMDVVLETKEEDGKTYVIGVETPEGYEGERIRGTTIGGINDQIDGLMNDVPIKEIINFGDEEENNLILNAIGDSTINGLGDAIDAITVQSLFKDDIYQSTLTLFVEYTYDGTPSFEYIYDSEGKIYGDDYSNLTFYYKVEGDDGYTISEFKSEEEITNKSSLESALKQYNCENQDDKITELYIYTTTYRQAVCDEFVPEGYCEEGTYYFDEYYLKDSSGYVKDSDGKYIVNGWITFSPNYIYYDENGNLAGDEGKLAELPSEGGTYYTYGETAGVWRFMVCERVIEYESDEVIGYHYNEILCGINNMDSLMTMTTKNLSSATLNEFMDIGILEAS
ncbi:MAG: hypothetical protein LUD29_01900, partial [Clostridia bacterium]|nr:hypothetical protein [Clostridia bacterium]